MNGIYDPQQQFETKEGFVRLLCNIRSHLCVGQLPSVRVYPYKYIMRNGRCACYMLIDWSAYKYNTLA